MFPVDRRRRILQRVAERQTIRIGELARELGVSEMTIRRDISRLEQDGFLRQTYGGATAHITKSIELAFNARALDHAAEKRLIGMRAADDLAATPVLYVGPGTTTEQFTLYLPEASGPQVITGSLPVASRLGSRSALVIALGGMVSEEELACFGPIATAALTRYRTDVAVIGAAGVSARFGVTEMDDNLAEVNRAALAHTARVVVLADASKIGTDSHAIVAPASAVGTLVTSVGAPLDELARLRAAGVDVRVVSAAVPRLRSSRRTGQAAGATLHAGSAPDGRPEAAELATDGAHRRDSQGKEAGR
ncbi:MAG TPA: DeoR/GlpR family DNA-binding transcription regulator [Streptosporangiaceae bacterium]|nr:DeoR/GlpR family DNA-binding transcription regulator [Streptosporangiaceae bacterium]